MYVVFMWADERNNGWVHTDTVYNVERSDYARMRSECAAGDGEDDDIAADLKDEAGNLIDTVLVSRQMKPRAVSMLRGK
jgi:hypothetical protein